MELDRTNKDNAYLTGRLIAVIEHYASRHFGPGTKTEMFNHPARLIGAFNRYVDDKDEYYMEIEAVPPVTVYSADEKSRMMVGYYHQRAEYGNSNEQERQRIGRRIAEIRKTVRWTDENGINRNGMTQRELAQLCGLHDSHIARIEKGRYSVGFDTLQSIADAMGYDIDLVRQ